VAEAAVVEAATVVAVVAEGEDDHKSK